MVTKRYSEVADIDVGRLSIEQAISLVTKINEKFGELIRPSVLVDKVLVPHDILFALTDPLHGSFTGPALSRLQNVSQRAAVGDSVDKALEDLQKRIAELDVRSSVLTRAMADQSDPTQAVVDAVWTTLESADDALKQGIILGSAGPNERPELIGRNAEASDADWQAVRAEVLRLLQAELLDTPAAHLAYVRDKIKSVFDHV